MVLRKQLMHGTDCSLRSALAYLYDMNRPLFLLPLLALTLWLPTVGLAQSNLPPEVQAVLDRANVQRQSASALPPPMGMPQARTPTVGVPQAPRIYTPPKGEYLILSGGPALREWEKLRVRRDQHDKWWGNFIRPSRVRIAQIRDTHGPSAQITWMVHRPSYVARAREEGGPYIDNILSVQRKYGCKLIWFTSGDEVINYINRGQNRGRVKIANLEFFGHSNKYCWMFDYSNSATAVSDSWIHAQDLHKIDSRAFNKDAFCKSWGCHTGEAMSSIWRKHVGVPLIGAVGKTDYRWISKAGGKLPDLSPGGRWSQ